MIVKDAVMLDYAANSKLKRVLKRLRVVRLNNLTNWVYL